MRMMPVSGEGSYHRYTVLDRLRIRMNRALHRINANNALAKLALLQFITAGTAIMALGLVFLDVFNGPFSFFLYGDWRRIEFIHQGHTISLDMPLLYAYSYLLLIIYGIVVGTGLVKSREWAWRWSRILPIMTIPFWVAFTWYLAEFYTLVRNNYRVSSDDMGNPPILSSDIGSAALHLLHFWLIISILYWWILKRTEPGSLRVVKNTPSFKIRAIHAMVVMAVALLILLNFRMPDGRILIHDTSSYGWTHVTNLLRILGQPVNARTHNGSTPLHFAAIAGRLGTVESLLQHGANINAQDSLGRTAIMAAAESDGYGRSPKADHIATIAMMIKRGADVRAKDCDGLTIANQIIHQSKYPSSLIKLMVTHGVPLNFGFNDYEWKDITLLGYAVERGRFEDVDFLLSHGAKMYPALVERANPKMLAHLLDMGFDVNSRDSEGRTPLHYAPKRADDGRECALVLLKHGADIHAKDKNKQTVLDIASDPPDDKWRIFLLKHGADSNIHK